MRRERGRAPVVVGIDSTGPACDAVEWAAAEAATRGCPLSIVQNFHPVLAADPYGVASAVDSLFAARAGADAVLRAAVARARSVASDVEVSGLLLPGTPTRTLLDAAAGAHLLVLGDRGLSGLRGLLARSVCIQIAARAACPVVVIRRARSGDRSPAAPLRVVLGVDATASCTSAIGFAFQAARQRGVPLTAVHAWTPDPPPDVEAVCAPPAVAEGLANTTLERAVDRWRSEFPDVPVVTSLVRGDPARTLVAAARGAAMVVVGSRGRGPVLGTVLGSVGQAVLRHGSSPLAIIRDHSAVTATPPAGPVHDHAVDRLRDSRRRRWPG